MKSPDNPQRVHTFLKQNAPTFYCDDCVAQQTQMNRHQVNTITSTLGLFPSEFERKDGTCQACKAEKLVTRAK